MNQELANKLIAWYEETIRLAKKKYLTLQVWRIICQRKVELGICSCAEAIFRISLFGDKWVMSKCASSMFWGSTPFHYSGGFFVRKKMIRALQLRVDILKTFKEDTHDTTI